MVVDCTNNVTLSINGDCRWPGIDAVVSGSRASHGHVDIHQQEAANLIALPWMLTETDEHRLRMHSTQSTLTDAQALRVPCF